MPLNLSNYRRISGLTEIPTPADTDVFAIDRAADVSTRKIQLANLRTKILENNTLFFKNVTVSVASSGQVVSKSDDAITADHVLTEFVLANPSAVTSDLTWTTSAGKIVITGTCTTATTADITLVKKSN